MGSAKTDQARLLDWSKVKGDPLACLTLQVQRFVRGIRGLRKTPVSRNQILAWFRGTPTEFTDRAITEACAQAKIACHAKSGTGRRHNAAYVYEAVES